MNEKWSMQNKSIEKIKMLNLGQIIKYKKYIYYILYLLK